MAEPIRLFDLNPHLDVPALRTAYAQDARLQVRDVMTLDSARALKTMLEHQTPWGLAWAAAGKPPSTLRAGALTTLPAAARARMIDEVSGAARRGDFAFLYAQYPMLDAYLQQWSPNGPHDIVLEHLNAAPMLDLVRQITGIAELRKADAQATLYAPGHFLTTHDDSHVAEGRRVAYVLGLATEWRPDWGGYLLFHDADGDIVVGYKPRFNALNLFTVPQRHSVSYVPPFAPVGRLAITGWFRDR
jgi:hypothetical protein